MISCIKEWFYLYHTDFFHKFNAISVKFVKNCRKCDIKCRISCNLRVFLPNRKYRKYRVIIVSKPKISCNIVWTQKNDIAQGWSKDTFCARQRLHRTQIILIYSEIRFFQFSMSDIVKHIWVFCLVHLIKYKAKFEYFCSWKVE